MALTAEQLADMQADLGIDDSEAVFTDEELERLFQRAAEDYNSAVYLAWRQLLANSARYIDYRVAQTEQKRSQVFAHIKEMVAFWGAESRIAGNQVMVAGMVEVPPRLKDAPMDNYTNTGRRARLKNDPYWP